MRIIDLLVIRPNPHPRASTRPSTLEMLRTKEHTPIFLSLCCFPFGLVVESIKKLRAVSMKESFLEVHGDFIYF